ncbi:acyltransferase [Adhaeribacter aquaticus]|uniref:acyltransferase n=1 Tax=Adhaeribacter aquaticus TaxID=299567 RepID=UPI00041C184F|nr:acyltransferase [Adhaeribacter aquaticus]
MFSKYDYKQLLHNLPEIQFQDMVLDLFRYQSQNNIIYKKYLGYLGIKVEEVSELFQIPFLPIEFFKTHAIKTGEFDPEAIFQSSGTTQTSRSRHFLPELNYYLHHAQRLFEFVYGPVTDYIFFALLPSYLEQGNSSLVAMVNHFIKQSGQQFQGFYLNEISELLANLGQARKTGKKIMLFGVTYALLDLAENVEKGALADVIIMETGGMKGRRKEMVREELHVILQEAFGVDSIHSEYGMTELLSQAYSKGKGIFEPSPTLKILLRDPNDPFSMQNNLRSGGINVIDLANIDSCAFIETKDIGKLYPDGRFEVLGRFDNSDIRGCNLLVT